MMLTVALVLEFLDLKAIHDLTHQLRTPIEAFFHRNPELLSLGRQIGQINSEAFGVPIYGNFLKVYQLIKPLFR